MRMWWFAVQRMVDTMHSTGIYARVVELVDTLALGASIVRCGGSSPLSRTIEKRRFHPSFFYGFAKK